MLTPDEFQSELGLSDGDVSLLFSRRDIQQADTDRDLRSTLAAYPAGSCL